MPLPKSLTCSSCQHTYPDGWKRCPYCGFDPVKQKRDRQIERALAKRFPSYAAVVNVAAGGSGQKRKPQSRRDRGQDRPARPGDQPRPLPPADATETDHKRSRRRRGRRRRGAGEGQQTAQPEGQPNQQRPPRDRRPATDPAPQQAAAGPPREPKPPQGDAAGGPDSQERRNRRRRPRRRRKPQGGGVGGGEPKSDS